jgi:membrane protein implicated in regulation of membrane protease activity
VTGGALVFSMLAGGAAVAALAAAFGAGPGLSFLVFAGVSLLMLLVVRPVAKRQMRIPAPVRTGVDALVGADALVVERVDGRDGRVKLGGEVWSARSYDGQSAFEEGDTVQVLRIEGATALVA